MNIRLATAADVPYMMKLERQCPAAAHWTEPQYREFFQSADKGPKRLVLLASENAANNASAETRSGAGDLWGFLVARHLAPEWELENIVVSPTVRRRGLGTRLLDALLSAARKTNSQSVFLEVRESNVAARALYQRAGFAPAGRRKSYYSDPPEDAVLYRRSLG